MEYGSYSNNVEETRQVKLGARYCFKTDIDFAMLAAIPSEYRKKNLNSNNFRRWTYCQQSHV